MKKQDVDKFLGELTELTRKYGIKIAACGCCDSPFLRDTGEEGKYHITEYPCDNGQALYESLTYYED